MPNALDLEIHDLINFILGDIQKSGCPWFNFLANLPYLVLKLRQKITQNTILSPFPFKVPSFMDDPY